MKALLQQSFFRLLSEYSQRKVSASELTKAVEELAIFRLVQIMQYFLFAICSFLYSRHLENPV